MTDEVTYPEHEKMKLIVAESQAIGEFLESCGYTLCEVRADEFWPVGKPITQILADYFDIDMVKIEEEKRAMLDEIRKQNEEARA